MLHVGKSSYALIFSLNVYIQVLSFLLIDDLHLSSVSMFLWLEFPTTLYFHCSFKLKAV